MYLFSMQKEEIHGAPQSMTKKTNTQLINTIKHINQTVN